MLSKEQILSANDIESKVVSVPEWGGEVMVVGLNATEKDEFENGLVTRDEKTGKAKANLKGATARLCALCIKDENGERLFADSEIVALGEKSGKAIKRVYDVAEDLSGLKPGEVEEIVKNSEKTQVADSD